MSAKNNSRFLSLVLRHKPETIGLNLDRNGWVTIGELLEQMESHNRNISYEELMKIVNSNDKKRFEIRNGDSGNSTNGKDDFIRAAQGHSVKVDLQLKTKRPPMELYHGTVPRFMPEIRKDGLKKMKRHAVHLSDDVKTAEKVGSRRGKEIILTVDTGAMHTDGFKFTQSKNGVWLVDNVPSKYIKIKE
tara:strand:- start:31591 stop:32157 length:567 start_codon:yes stop_codon:yes gene_type:complete